jgi:hypothetical protein
MKKKTKVGLQPGDNVFFERGPAPSWFNGDWLIPIFFIFAAIGMLFVGYHTVTFTYGLYESSVRRIVREEIMDRFITIPNSNITHGTWTTRGDTICDAEGCREWRK